MPLAMWEDRKRFARIGKALSKAYAPTLRILGAETDSVLLGVLEGMLPMLEQLAEAVGIGALLGGAVGALGGPADELTVPGGAMAGAELALWITGALGIKELLGNGLKNWGRSPAWPRMGWSWRGGPGMIRR